ncbi:MAG TPA: P-loop NTPase fold protein, partial [Pyrinomonadaceae bacterium]|nr:P-loop NTPase fold protein [Pyrinomonadaceae bacterium]
MNQPNETKVKLEYAPGADPRAADERTMPSLRDSFSPTPELAEVLSRAVIIRQYVNDTEYSSMPAFTSILLGILSSSDAWSRWFQNYVQASGISIEKICTDAGLRPEVLMEVASRPIYQVPIEWDSPDAGRLLQIAKELSGRIGTAKKDQYPSIRHVMGAYIYYPLDTVSEKILAEWGFNRLDWSNAFLTKIKEWHRSELAFWTAAHYKVFGEEPLVTFSLPERKAHETESTAPARGEELSPSISAETTPIVRPDRTPLHLDNPSTRDHLGRKGFAQALAVRLNRIWNEYAGSGVNGSFALHIHGSWGSGKTSLLNLLREELQSAGHDARARQQRNGSDSFAQTANGNWIVVDFNAWQHQRIDPPWWPLMDTVYRRAFEQTKNVYGRRLRAWDIRCRERWWRFSTGRRDYLITAIVSIFIFVGMIFWLSQPGGDTAQNSFWANLETVLKPVGAILSVVAAVWSTLLLTSRSLIS